MLIFMINNNDILNLKYVMRTHKLYINYFNLNNKINISDGNSKLI